MKNNEQILLDYLEKLGFDSNPFEYTNADQEDRLPDYFVPPPYFASVFGDPNNPTSFIVYAPRGGGKSAQRRMIEQKCSEENVLAITYDHFEFPNVTNAKDIQLHQHLRNIIRFILLGLLIDLYNLPEFKKDLDRDDRRILLAFAAEYLGEINETELDKAINSLKGLKEKFRSFWNDWLPAIRPASNFISKLLKGGLDFGDLSKLEEFREKEFRTSESLKYQLKLLVKISKNLSWRSIYILIDRVDESALTGNNVTDSFNLIKPILRDLQLLEFEGIAFKLFLWDLLQPLCDEVVRTDRIPQETLDWDISLLRQLLERRLFAYSGNKIKTLIELSEKTSPFNIDELVFIFASHSPRDLIRIGYNIISEQVEYNLKAEVISSNAVYTGISKFCSRKSGELFSKDRILKDLRKVRQVDFTIPYLANEIFKEKQASTRNRMMAWRNQAAIIEVERIEVSNSENVRNVKLFAIKDIRVAKEIFPELTVSEFLEKKFKRCPNCDSTILRDWGEIDSSSICHDCQTDLLTDGKDTWDTWRRKELAVQRRRRYRSETVQPVQLGLFDSSDSE